MVHCLEYASWFLLREKCPYSEYSGPYSVRMRENTDQSNSSMDAIYTVSIIMLESTSQIKPSFWHIFRSVVFLTSW